MNRYASVLAATVDLSKNEGIQVHAHIVNSDVKLDDAVKNALITMYAKHGRIEDAAEIFHSMLFDMNLNLITWNAMIGAYSRKGLLNEV